jgi:glycosyltransferase involved in cell wall biosynthesis
LAVHQVVVSASSGDAITNFALELRALYSQLGRSEIFAAHVDPALHDDVHLLPRYCDVAGGAGPSSPSGDGSSDGSSDGLGAGARPGDTIVYHASIGNQEVVDFLRSRPERLVLVYHNVSPPESFDRYEPTFAALLRAGRDDLVELRPRIATAVAVSSFNAADLEQLGYTDVRVVPLIIDPARMHDVAPDEVMRRHLDENVHGPLALFVGQLLPHKRPELLVEALHVVATYLEPTAHLVLLGARRVPAFAAAVQRQIVELGLANAWITGVLSTAELRCYYDRADVFVTASDHEGFCMPLVEAMSFDVPVVARGTSAVPETMGGAGIVLDPSDGPLVFAEAWEAAATDPALRTPLVARGRERVAEFDPERARADWLELIAS